MLNYMNHLAFCYLGTLGLMLQKCTSERTAKLRLFVELQSIRLAETISVNMCDCCQFVYLSFRPHYGPGVDSASKGNEYRES
jgi:hypothetical protein